MGNQLNMKCSKTVFLRSPHVSGGKPGWPQYWLSVSVSVEYSLRLHTSGNRQEDPKVWRWGTGQWYKISVM